MKKIISLLLVTVMLALALPLQVGASPSGLAMNFQGDGVYILFGGTSIVSTNGSISFDLSMTADSEGDPVLSMNGQVDITPTTIKIGSRTTQYSWGSTDIARFRKVEIAYNGGTITVSIDGQAVATGSGSYGVNYLYFIGYPGHLYLDNLLCVSAGLPVLDLDFDDEGEYLNHKSADSSAARGQIPSNSYYTYTETAATDNVAYIFDSLINAMKLTVQSGVEMQRGDCNGDGDITSRDARVLKQVIAGVDNIEYNEILTDVNADGDITARDSRTLKQILVGQSDPIAVIINGSSASADYDNAMQAALLSTDEMVLEGVDATLAMDPIDPETYPYAVVTFMTPNSTEDHNSSAANKSGFGAWGNIVQYNLNTDGRFHSEIIDLSGVSTWNGDAATLRFFVTANAGDRIYIDSIIFSANMTKATEAKNQREAAKASLTIRDGENPVPGGAIGAYNADGSYEIVFDTAAKVSSKVTAGNNTTVSFSDDAIKARATAGGDPGFYVDLIDEQISANNFKYIAYVYKNPSSNVSNKQANIYYVVNGIDRPTGGYETPLFGGVKGSTYAVAIIDLTEKSNWSGAIKGLRIDYFTDCTTNDVSYIDSIIFATSSSLAGKAGNARLRDRNGDVGGTTAEIWNAYWKYYQNANSYEYITGSPTNLSMYFRYGSASKLTPRSLEDRMARAITNATGYDVSCKLYSYNFLDLDWSDSVPQAYMYYVLTFDGESYVATVKTYIIKDSGYSDSLDGTANDPQMSYQNTSTWNSSGYSITDSHACTSYGTYVAYHSNHEIKLLETPYGSFAVHHVSGEDGGQNYEGGGRFSLFRIYDNGTSKTLGTYDCTCHSTKPQILYGDDGLVYFIMADDSTGNDVGHVSLGYFDPSQPNADGTYNITYSRTTHPYPGGPDPSGGGYGYSAPVLDPVSGNIYMFYCGGRDELGFYLTWFTYNYRTHTWGSGSHTAFMNDYRYCYLYGYPDGAGGVYLVAERACLLECLGLAGVIYDSHYAWEQIRYFHVKNPSNGNSTTQIVIPADYSQIDREMYPGCTNAHSDVFLTSDNKLHVLWQDGMHGRSHHAGISSFMWHCVYDIASPGAEPELLYKEPIAFSYPDNSYAVRMVENTSGHLFILAMPASTNARCEIWRATNALGTEFELVACRNFSNTKAPLTGLLAGNNRNNSVVDNTVTCMYAVDGDRYMHFIVTLPAN